jgi:hypothetical protein
MKRFKLNVAVLILNGNPMLIRSNFLRAIVASAAIAMPFSVNAHSEHGKPQYGGVVGEAGAFQVEFVPKSDSLTLYVTDHGKPVSVKGATAKLTMLSGTTKSEVELKPTNDGTKLESKGTFNVTKGTKIVSIVTLAGKSPSTARFEIK